MTTAPGAYLSQKSVTIVIPCMNEEGNLERLFEYLEETFQSLGYTLPVVLIDDGSTDGTAQILSRLRRTCRFLTVLRHSHNRGVAEVWNTALAHVKTDWILWGQADLESDPRTDIPALLAACSPGVDAIAGWRQGRGDGKLGASSLANRACRWAFGLQIHDMNWIKLVRRDRLAQLPINLITHRYLLAVIAGQGHRVIEVPTPWHPRFSGASKFGRGRLFTAAADFLRVTGWFYILQPLETAHRYGRIALEAAHVGMRAAGHAFRLKASSPQTTPQRQPLPSGSAVANIAYYRQLALSKVSA